MKVAIITERIDPSLGGAERSVYELAQALSETGMATTVLVAKSQTKMDHVHVLFPDSYRKRVDQAQFTSAIRAYLAQESYDIVHSVLPHDFADVYQPRGGSYAETIVRSAASYENRFIGSIKQLTAFTNRRRHPLLSAERSLSSGANGPVIAALSRYVVEQFTNHYRTPANRIALVANGIKADIATDPGTVQTLRGRIDAQLDQTPSSESVRFLFAAHNFRLKGLGPLLRAMAKLNKLLTPNRRCHLVVAGHGKSDLYICQAKRLGIDRDIAFLGSVTNIRNALALCDVAVLPTFYDPSSRFILEALAAGKPVITTRFNGATDLFETDRHGLVLADPTDITALSNALHQLSDRHTIRTMAQAIETDAILEKVSIQRVAREMTVIYSDILANRKQANKSRFSRTDF